MELCDLCVTGLKTVLPRTIGASPHITLAQLNCAKSVGEPQKAKPSAGVT